MKRWPHEGDLTITPVCSGCIQVNARKKEEEEKKSKVINHRYCIVLYNANRKGYLNVWSFSRKKKKNKAKYRMAL
jgi:hypothetical protein